MLISGFDFQHAASYWYSIVTTVLKCTNVELEAWEWTEGQMGKEIPALLNALIL